MKDSIRSSVIKTASIHKERLLHALHQLEPLFPFTAEKINHLSEQDFLLLELLTNRFAKLQDIMGSKLIDIFLELVGEATHNLTMIDKLHQLEKFNLIQSADIWLEMRQLRNHLSHEYPDQPELVAEYLNETTRLATTLIEFFNSLLCEITAKSE